jgi:hypothetical protein
MTNSFISVFGAGGGGTDATKLPLAGGTLTGALINSTNGAASAPVVSLTGTTFTGGTATTTKPTLIVEPTGTTSTGWSTAGTLIGANAATGFTGRLIDCQLNGVSKFAVTSAGGITTPQLADTANQSSIAGNILETDGNGPKLRANGSAYSFAHSSGIFLYATTAVAGIGTTQLGLGSSPSSSDVFLNRAAGATLQLGASSVSGWLSQTFAAAGGRVGTDTNNSPTNTLTIAGSISTGTGTGGNLRLGVYGTNGTSGTAIGTLNTVLTVVAARKVINLAGIPTSSSGLSSGDVYSNAGILTIVA